MINKVYIEYLLLKAQSGEHAALQELLTIVRSKLIRFAKQTLNNPSLAEDAVQEALFAILKGINKLKDHRAFHGWIYTILRHKCHDQLRLSYKNNEYELNLVAQKSEAPEQTSDSLDMISAIQSLNNAQQSVLMLFYYEGFKVREIAQILDKPAGSIKSLLFDARRQIKTIIGEE